MEARVEALMENLAMAVMQANNLAADSPQYEALADIVAYALDLTDMGFSAESNAFAASEPPKAPVTLGERSKRCLIVIQT